MSTERDWVTTRCSSESACVQVRCETAECVEVAVLNDGTVSLRSTLAPSEILRITREEWVAFVVAVKAGQFDAV